ncbi:phiSA1p31-related protein [Streptomyces sp. EN16]|uniref:phiSA1p31-related protein n=1 Tax=Streptomyces sp. EN16 TaxID=212773 RepID=UPI00085182CF|nr:phiSA1p31-related protein [Streptomyces sp. EN16]
MATAQYETRTRTVEETVVVLTLTEDEAVELRQHIEKVPVSGVVYRVYEALTAPTAAQPAPSTDTFEYEGVTYDLNAKYTDKDGDVWSFRRRASGDTEGHFQGWDEGHWDGFFDLPYVAQKCAPLTKVTP